MRNQFICEIPECVRDHLSRQAAEELDAVFDDLDSAEERIDGADDVDVLWGLRRPVN